MGVCDVGPTNRGSCWEEQLECAPECGGVDEISEHSKSPGGIHSLSCTHRESIYELWCTMRQARTSSLPFAGVDMRVFDTPKVASYVGRVTAAIGSFDVRTSMSHSTTSVMRQEQLGCLLEQTKSTARPTWLCVTDVSTSNGTL